MDEKIHTLDDWVVMQVNESILGLSRGKFGVVLMGGHLNAALQQV